MKKFVLMIALLQCVATHGFAQVATQATEKPIVTTRERTESIPPESHESNEPIQAIIYLDQPQALASTENRAESSASSPPLTTDDPGTPGKHGYEINFITNCDRTSGSHACESGIDAAFGIGEKVQLRISKAATLDQVTGAPPTTGFNATDIGVKWRFYDRNGLQVATFPSLQLDDATRVKNPDGTLAESDGRSLYLPLIVSKDIGEKLTVVANIAYRANLDYANKDSVFTSIALGRSFGPNSRGMVEVASEGFTNSRRTDVRIGWIKVLFPNPASRYQTSFFTSLGQSIGPTDDGKSHQTILFGISVARNPD